MSSIEKIAFEEGQIIAQMIGLTRKPIVPDYYAGGAAEAFMLGFFGERGRMKRRVERARLG